MKFFVGLHQPSDARHFERCCISVNRLWKRKSDFSVGEWMMDSGAFTEISTHGQYRYGVSPYAEQIRRWASCGQLVAAVAQDYMCEPFILKRTGLTVAEHQRLTVERFDALMALNLPVYVMPVLQGFLPEEYLDHLRLYGPRLSEGAWVGVGSVCKRNGSPDDIANVLGWIKSERPDLRLHGFGLKLSALKEPQVVAHLYSADSMAWSFSARMQGRDGNDWREAKEFIAKIGAPRKASALQMIMRFQ